MYLWNKLLFLFIFSLEVDAQKFGAKFFNFKTDGKKIEERTMGSEPGVIRRLDEAVVNRIAAGEVSVWCYVISSACQFVNPQLSFRLRAN